MLGHENGDSSSPGNTLCHLRVVRLALESEAWLCHQERSHSNGLLTSFAGHHRLHPFPRASFQIESSSCARVRDGVALGHFGGDPADRVGKGGTTGGEPAFVRRGQPTSAQR